MLTQRQKEVLQLIVELYSRLEEPIGSKTLLNESCLEVSPATIRNDMVVLEHQGFLKKAHSSSGRIPSNQAFRYYVDGFVLSHLVEEGMKEREDYRVIESLFEDYYYNPIQLGQLALEMLVKMTGYTGFLLRQNNEIYHFDELKLIPLSKNKVIVMLVIDSGRVDNQLVNLPISLSKEEIDKVSQLINEELRGSSLEDAYQRLKLSIPLQIQRLIGYQLDFSDLIEQTLVQLKTHQYKVIGKLNIFDTIGHQLDINSMKHLFHLLDGSKELYDIIEKGQNGVNVSFGFEFAPETLPSISIVYTKYLFDNQKICLGLFGPSTMHYQRIISIMRQVTSKFVEK